MKFDSWFQVQDIRKLWCGQPQSFCFSPKAPRSVHDSQVLLASEGRCLQGVGMWFHRWCSVWKSAGHLTVVASHRGGILLSRWLWWRTWKCLPEPGRPGKAVRTRFGFWSHNVPSPNGCVPRHTCELTSCPSLWATPLQHRPWIIMIYGMWACWCVLGAPGVVMVLLHTTIAFCVAQFRSMLLSWLCSLLLLSTLRLQSVEELCSLLLLSTLRLQSVEEVKVSVFLPPILPQGWGRLLGFWSSNCLIHTHKPTAVPPRCST